MLLSLASCKLGRRQLYEGVHRTGNHIIFQTKVYLVMYNIDQILFQIGLVRELLRILLKLAYSWTVGIISWGCTLGV